MPNPKLDQAEKLMMDRAGKSICYFSADKTIVRKNAVRLSKSGVGGVHALYSHLRLSSLEQGNPSERSRKKTGKEKRSS